MDKEKDQREFVELRCKICNRFICEISADATGEVRRKCEKCKHQVKISLSAMKKTTTILAGQSTQRY